MAELICHYLFLKDDDHWNLEDAKRLMIEHNLKYVDIEETKEIICFNTGNLRDAGEDTLRLLPLTPLVFLLLKDVGEEDEVDETLEKYMRKTGLVCNVQDCDKTLCREQENKI